MRCPKCGTDLPEGALLCEKCGEEIHIVPDYDPTLDVSISIEGPEEEKTPGETDPDPGKPRRTKLYLLRALLILLALVVIGLAIAANKNLKRMQSPEYQIAQAEKYQGIGEYSKAIACYSKAIELEEDNVELLLRLAEVYYLKNDQAWYEATLLQILSHKSVSAQQIDWALERMIPLLIKKGDFEGINRLLGKYPNEKLLKENEEYLAPKPRFSLEEGTYVDIQSLSILSDAEGTLYYTLDGTVPGETSETFTMPIVLDLGEVTVKACLINSYGVKSEVIEGTYTIVAPEPKQEKK